MSGVIESQRYKDKIKAAIAAIRMRDFAENSLSRQTGNWVRTPLACRFVETPGTSAQSKHAGGMRTHLLAELLIGQKDFGIFLLKENQPHFFQLPVGRQKVFDRARRNFGSFSARICVDPSRDRGEGNRTQILLDSQR